MVKPLKFNVEKYSIWKYKSQRNKTYYWNAKIQFKIQEFKVT